MNDGASQSYHNRNDVALCVCGAARTDVPTHIYYVGEYDNSVWSSYYYRCPGCRSFSAVNIHFEPGSYAEVSIDLYSIPDLKRTLNSERVNWIRHRANIPRAAVIYDLGAGEGAFTHALRTSFPEGRIYSIEFDQRMPARFAIEYAGATVVAKYIEQFLGTDGIAGTADLIVLTDVLEHVVNPRSLLSQILNALRPGGYAYITVPNSESLLQQTPVTSGDVAWEKANRTCQHLWVLDKRQLLLLVSEFGELVEYSSTFETQLRNDSAYSTFLLRRPQI